MEKYTKVKAIGKGNMGTCTLARNNEDGQCYVIKQVDLTRLSKKDRQQSLNEARVLSSLRHPNIINYVDSFLARRSDSLCIVMEFAEGGDVATRLKKSYGVNLPERQVLDWLIQLALSLHYIHQRKILHRDVKTQNIFLTGESLIKLGDFGISRTLASTYDQAQTFVGTPYYLSPELILEQPYDHRSDVWALGVVLYEMMAMHHPFNAKDMKGLLQCILAVHYDPLPPVYSAGLRDIVGRLLVRKPSDRMDLEEVLQLPIVTNRIRQWLTDEDSVPRHYVRSLCRHGLLPAELLAEAGSGGAAVPTVQTVGEAAAAAAAVAAATATQRRRSSVSTSGHSDPCNPSAVPSPRVPFTGLRSPVVASPPDCVRPQMPPLKPHYAAPTASASPPPLPGRQLQALHHHLQGSVEPLPRLQPLSPPPAAGLAAASPSPGIAKAPLTTQERLSTRKRGEVSRQSSLTPPPSHVSTGRSWKAGRAAARPYVAQLHATPRAYVGGDRMAQGPPSHLLHLPTQRKQGGELRRGHAAGRASPGFLNPLYRPPNPTTPPYSQLAPLPPPSSDIKAMLHRAAVDRARRRQELNS